ncbi:MAG: hypothetical protein IH948_00710 [Bacteroidetes bacterium]|nr:hypothetical protein [Bacteroidota bacterium]
MQLLEKRPDCETPNCENQALGRLGNKWRCGICIMKFEQALIKAREKFYIEEEKKISEDLE